MGRRCRPPTDRDADSSVKAHLAAAFSGKARPRHSRSTAGALSGVHPHSGHDSPIHAFMFSPQSSGTGNVRTPRTVFSTGHRGSPAPGAGASPLAARELGGSSVAQLRYSAAVTAAVASVPP